jgi:membrane protein YdbS with pleckstrin-like domain
VQNHQELNINAFMPSKKKMVYVAVILELTTFSLGCLIANLTSIGEYSLLMASIVWGVELSTITAFIYVGWLFYHVITRYRASKNGV